MSAAFFILAINVCVAGIFATAFAVVAVTTRAAISARWLSAAYGMGALYAVLEFILPLHGPMPVLSVAVFTAFLLAEGLMVIGLAWHYNVPPPWRVLLGLVLVSILINVAILDMPRPSLVRALLYQGPYAAMQVIAVVVMLAAPPARRGAARRARSAAALALYHRRHAGPWQGGAVISAGARRHRAGLRHHHLCGDLAGQRRRPAGGPWPAAAAAAGAGQYGRDDDTLGNRHAVGAAQPAWL